MDIPERISFTRVPVSWSNPFIFEVKVLPSRYNSSNVCEWRSLLLSLVDLTNVKIDKISAPTVATVSQTPSKSLRVNLHDNEIIITIAPLPDKSHAICFP